MVVKTEAQIFFSDPVCLAACESYVARMLGWQGNDTPPVVMSVVRTSTSLKIRFWPQARLEETDALEERIVGFRDGWNRREEYGELQSAASASTSKGEEHHMARDPERISEILSLLEEVWRKNPDLRLGQVIEIAKSMFDNGAETFYIEDDNLKRGLECLRDSMTKSPADTKQE